MADRFYNNAELPDVGTDPATPDSGYISVYGKNGRLYARNSAGTVYDLTFILQKASQAQAEAGTNDTRYMTPLKTAQAITARLGSEVIRSYVFAVSDESTINWPEEWASPPHVALTPLSETANQPVSANLLGVTETTVTIRGRQIAALNIASWSGDVHVIARGVLA